MQPGARTTLPILCAAGVLLGLPGTTQAGSRFTTSAEGRVEEQVQLDFTIRIPELIYLRATRSAGQKWLGIQETESSAAGAASDHFAASTNAGTLAFAQIDTSHTKSPLPVARSEGQTSATTRAYVVAAP